MTGPVPLERGLEERCKLTCGVADDTEGAFPQQHCVFRTFLLSLVCALTVATSASADDGLWLEAERMESLVEAAHDRAEASDPSTELGARLHAEALAAHHEYRGYLKALLALSPPIHSEDRELVMSTLLTSLEADAVLRLHMGACSEAQLRLEHLAAHEEVQLRPELLRVTHARALDAEACLLAQGIAQNVLASADQMPPVPEEFLHHAPPRRRGGLIVGGSAVVVGALLAGIARYNRQSARVMVRDGDGTVNEYNDARRRGDRTAAASAVFAAVGAATVSVSLLRRGDRQLAVAIGPREVGLQVRW